MFVSLLPLVLLTIPITSVSKGSHKKKDSLIQLQKPLLEPKIVYVLSNLNEQWPGVKKEQNDRNNITTLWSSKSVILGEIIPMNSGRS